MKWELISEFDRLLDEGGNTEDAETRKRLTVWEMRRQVKLAFYGKETDPYGEERPFIWVDQRDISELIEYLQSGQRNNVDSNKEIEELIKDLKQIGSWL